MPIRTLIVADDLLMRQGIRLFLEMHKDIALVGDTSPAEAVVMATRELPDVIFLDLDSKNAKDLDLLSDLHTAIPQARILVLIRRDYPEFRRKAILRGASGWLPVNATQTTFLQAIREVSAGGVWPKGKTDPLSLFFDLEEYTPADIAEVLGYLSECYQAIGGDKLVIDEITLLDPSLILEPVGT